MMKQILGLSFTMLYWYRSHVTLCTGLLICMCVVPNPMNTPSKSVHFQIQATHLLCIRQVSSTMWDTIDPVVCSASCALLNKRQKKRTEDWTVIIVEEWSRKQKHFLKVTWLCRTTRKYADHPAVSRLLIIIINISNSKFSTSACVQ